MTEIITRSPEEVTPDRAAVFENQGIPPGTVVTEEIDALCTEALALFARASAPFGILMEVSEFDFEVIYHGEGQNEPRTPVEDILPRADFLALFAVTVGQRVSREIEDRFAADDFALGAMLDSAASAAADRMAQIAQDHYAGVLSRAGQDGPDVAVLRYSPGYCGWHISGQKKLFEFLQPGQIGVSLRESYLMEPLKSVSGVIIAGPREVHCFVDAYPFCSQCDTKGCRKRIEALQAG